MRMHKDTQNCDSVPLTRLHMGRPDGQRNRGTETHTQMRWNKGRRKKEQSAGSEDQRARSEERGSEEREAEEREAQKEKNVQSRKTTREHEKTRTREPATKGVREMRDEKRLEWG